MRKEVVKKESHEERKREGAKESCEERELEDLLINWRERGNGASKRYHDLDLESRVSV